MSNENSNSDKIEHLVYEIQMFCNLAKGIDLIERSKISTQIKDDATKNVILENDTVKYALLESFLVHARNIIKFLSRDNRHKKYRCYDINYKDILENSENISPFINDDEIKNIKDSINNEILHLSKCRESDKKTQWVIQEVACKLVPGIEKFMNEVEDRKIEFDKNYKDEIREEINYLKTNFCKNESNKEPAPSISTSTTTNGTFVISHASQQTVATPLIS